MVLFPYLIPQLSQKQIIPCPLQYIENPCILTSTYSGIVTIISLPVSVVSTLTHWPKVVCTGPALLTKELQHLRRVLTKCIYPKWALDKFKRKINNWEDSNTKGKTQKKAPATSVMTPQEGSQKRKPQQRSHSHSLHTRTGGKHYEDLQ